MAIAYTRVAAYPDKYQTITDITLDASYAAGGYVLSAAQLGVLSIDHIDASFVTGEGFAVTYVASTGKLKILKTGAGLSGAFAECIGADLTTAMKVRVNVTGRPVL